MDVRNARLTLAFRISNSPTFTGATKSKWSILAVTVNARACREAAIAPTRSMYCINRPPNKLPIAFESAGSTISLRSDCDSDTFRSTTNSLISYKSKSRAVSTIEPSHP